MRVNYTTDIFVTQHRLLWKICNFCVMVTECLIYVTEMKESEYADLITYLKEAKYPSNVSQSYKNLIQERAQFYKLCDGTLYYGQESSKKELMTASQRKECFIECHIDGQRHFSEDETVARLFQTYHWDGMHRDVCAFFRDCSVCCENKVDKNKSLEPWTVVRVSLHGPYNATNFKDSRHIVEIVDVNTSWTILKSAKITSTQSFCESVADEFLIYGWPAIIYVKTPVIIDVTKLLSCFQESFATFGGICNDVKIEFPTISFRYLNHNGCCNKLDVCSAVLRQLTSDDALKLSIEQHSVIFVGHGNLNFLDDETTRMRHNKIDKFISVYGDGNWCQQLSSLMFMFNHSLHGDNKTSFDLVFNRSYNISTNVLSSKFNTFIKCLEEKDVHSSRVMKLNIGNCGSTYFLRSTQNNNKGVSILSKPTEHSKECTSPSVVISTNKNVEDQAADFQNSARKQIKSVLIPVCSSSTCTSNNKVASMPMLCSVVTSNNSMSIPFFRSSIKDGKYLSVPVVSSVVNDAKSVSSPVTGSSASIPLVHPTFSDNKHESVASTLDSTIRNDDTMSIPVVNSSIDNGDCSNNVRNSSSKGSESVTTDILRSAVSHISTGVNNTKNHNFVTDISVSSMNIVLSRIPDTSVSNDDDDDRNNTEVNSVSSPNKDTFNSAPVSFTNSVSTSNLSESSRFSVSSVNNDRNVLKSTRYSAAENFETSVSRSSESNVKCARTDVKISGLSEARSSVVEDSSTSVQVVASSKVGLHENSSCVLSSSADNISTLISRSTESLNKDVPISITVDETNDNSNINSFVMNVSKSSIPSGGGTDVDEAVTSSNRLILPKTKNHPDTSIVLTCDSTPGKIPTINNTSGLLLNSVNGSRSLPYSYLLIPNDNINKDATAIESDVNKRNELRYSKYFVCNDCKVVFNSVSAVLEHRKLNECSAQVDENQKHTDSSLKIEDKCSTVSGENGDDDDAANHPHYENLIVECEKRDDEYEPETDYDEDACSNTTEEFHLTIVSQNVGKKRYKKQKPRRPENAVKRPFKCPVCVGTYLRSRKEWDIHIKCHANGERKLVCYICQNDFSTWSHLTRHLHINHKEPELLRLNGETKRKCDKCFKIFTCADGLRRHEVNVHQGTKSIGVCDTCGKSYKDPKTFRNHQERHQGVFFRCKLCPYKTTTTSSLRRHKRIHDDNAHVCPVCSKRFSIHSHLKVHMIVHDTTREKVVCHQCGLTLKSESSLKSHISTMHMEGDPQYFCQKCDYVGKTSVSLQRHDRRKHQKQFQCTKCEFAGATELSLKRHDEMYHNIELRPYGCTHCKYRSKNRKQLLEHVRSQHNPNSRRFECNFCNMKFKTLTVLRDHMPSHTGELLHACKLCDYRARHRQTLYSHARTKHKDYSLQDVIQTPGLESIKLTKLMSDGAVPPSRFQDLILQESPQSSDDRELSDDHYAPMSVASVQVADSVCGEYTQEVVINTDGNQK